MANKYYQGKMLGGGDKSMPIANVPIIAKIINGINSHKVINIFVNP
jgi:hypothetical protein